MPDRVGEGASSEPRLWAWKCPECGDMSQASLHKKGRYCLNHRPTLMVKVQVVERQSGTERERVGRYVPDACTCGTHGVPEYCECPQSQVYPPPESPEHQPDDRRGDAVDDLGRELNRALLHVVADPGQRAEAIRIVRVGTVAAVVELLREAGANANYMSGDQKMAFPMAADLIESYSRRTGQEGRDDG